MLTKRYLSLILTMMKCQSVAAVLSVSFRDLNG